VVLWDGPRSVAPRTAGRNACSRRGKVGKVEDMIVAPDKAVSYVILGVGGFLGLDRQDVAIPSGQLKFEGGKLTLPGATKEALKVLPKFEYVK